MPGEYTEAWLKQAIAMATQLRFWDDVEHWKAELKKLQGETNG